MSSELPCRHSPSGRSYLYAAHKHADPRLVGTRRLMLIPNYLSTNCWKNVYKLIMPYALRAYPTV